MHKKNGFNLIRPWIGIVLLWAAVQTDIGAQGSQWERKEVNWRVTGGSTIKAIYYPSDQNLPLLENRSVRNVVSLQPRTTANGKTTTVLTTVTGEASFANVINSPPIDGFMPYVAVGITDKWSDEIYNTDAYTEYSVAGNYLPGRQKDYVIGIFDTGSSAHIINAYDAEAIGIYNADLVTSITVSILGATAAVDAFVSMPLGIFADGLGAIDGNTLLIDDSNMVGQSNVAIVVGDAAESPNLPTIVGSPLAFFFTAVIENSNPKTMNFDGNEITAPSIHFYDHSDSRIPAYSNKIYLELLPSTAYAVQFMPCFEILGETCPEWDGEPSTPSIVFGTSFDAPQSLFFATRTDLAHGSRTSQQKKFMFDTGAQITVVSESQAAELELLANEPNFYVEISDATGAITIADGYYVDELEISATPSWLSFTHAPVVVLDVNSPEGGVLEGIIGMNLFVDTDLYIHGGGLSGQDQPYVKFAFLPAGIAGDIEPPEGDGLVNIFDLSAFAEAWLAEPLSPDWNSKADMVSDAIINFYDFAILAGNWQ